MAMTFLTNLKFEPKGTHNPAQAYSVMDVVISADGSIAYAAVKDVPAGTALSSNGGYWVKLLDLSALKDGIPAEKIEEAVNAYLEENPVSGGATQEQAAQIEQNKQDIADLKENGVGEPGEDGGYYIPSVSFESGDELNDYLNVEFAPSKADMPPVLSEMIPMRKAKNGVTFTPHVDAEGNLSWTNDGGYANPEEVNIKGEPGEPGYTPRKGIDYSDGESGGYYLPELYVSPNNDSFTITFTPSKQGMNDDVPGVTLPIIKGDKGDSPVRGTDYWTASDIAEIKSYVDDAILGGAW